MKVHYYLGWFNEFFPKKLVTMLQEDINDRKSLVMISATLSEGQGDSVGTTERAWLKEANIIFDDYHIIDYSVDKEDAHQLIADASVIFLLGGNTLDQNKFLLDFDLMDLIKDNRSLVMGTSAGAINMSSKWLDSKFTNQTEDTMKIRKGIGLDDFSVLSHFDLENNMMHIQRALSPLLSEMNVYASNKDCAIRVKDNDVEIIGDVYLVTQTAVEKLVESL